MKSSHPPVAALDHRAGANSPHREPRRRVGRVLVVAFCSIFVGSCTGPSRLERMAEARHDGLTLQADFTHAVDAAHRSVMVDDDDASMKFAREAEQARAEVLRDVQTLSAHLERLDFGEERKMLDDFQAKFTAYEVLDRNILELAVTNTNLKAMRLSFGPVREARDAFEAGVMQVAAAAPEAERWHARALALEAVAALRGIHELEAPHIAELNDAPMTRIEGQMQELAAKASSSLEDLVKLTPTAAEAVDQARAALARFREQHAQVLELSRANTDVRSIALTLGEKRTLIASCEESLKVLSEALARRMDFARR